MSGADPAQSNFISFLGHASIPAQIRAQQCTCGQRLHDNVLINKSCMSVSTRARFCALQEASCDQRLLPPQRRGPEHSTAESPACVHTASEGLPAMTCTSCHSQHALRLHIARVEVSSTYSTNFHKLSPPSTVVQSPIPEKATGVTEPLAVITQSEVCYHGCGPLCATSAAQTLLAPCLHVLQPHRSSRDASVALRPGLATCCVLRAACYVLRDA